MRGSGYLFRPRVNGNSTVVPERHQVGRHRDLELVPPPPSTPAPALYPHWNVEPSDDAVDGDILLRSLTERLPRYVIISEDQALVVALWILPRMSGRKHN
jgi:hypothetical protein